MKLKALIAAAAISLVMLIAPAPAWASAGVFEPEKDVVKLKDGRELRGIIVKEQNGYIWLDMGVGQEMFLAPDKIEEIVRGSDEPIPTEIADVQEDTGWERVPGVTRAAVITAEGMVGMQMASKPLHEAIEMLHEEGVDLVVYKVKSGGGLLLEIQKLSDVLENEYKPEFQLVAWIDSAISAAAMTALTIENVYFMPHGHLGAATGWSGQLVAMKGRGLEAVYYKMEKISARGNKDDKIIKAMQHNIELSYDVNEDTGDVTFYQNLTGEFILNDGTDVLTLSSDEAVHCGFSAGTAGTLEELQSLLEESIGEIVWVGEEVDGIPYPVCNAEKHQIEYREEVDYQDARFGEVLTKYRMELGNAQSVAIDRRGGFLRQAERHLARIKRMVKINPNFALLNLPEGWIEAQEELIRELRRR